MTIAGHDHLAGMAGAGVGRDELANSVGTAETIVARIPAPPDMARAVDQRVAVTVYPGAEDWAALVSAARAGIVVTAAAKKLGHSPPELDALAEGADPHEGDLSETVERLAHQERAELPDGPPGAVWAGLLEALVARTAEACERLVAVTGPARRLVVFGGGSVSRPWLAAKQSRLPLPVIASPVRSPVARGAAIQAGVAAGWWAEPSPTPSGP